MKRILTLLVAASIWAVPASAQFTTNLLPKQDREAVREGQQMSLGQIYDILRNRYRGGNPVDARLNGDRYFIRWEVNGRVMDLVVSAQNGAVLSERG